MKHLTGSDNYFLALEDERAHMHVASIGIYDPSTAPGGAVRFKQILEFLAERASYDSRFRRRLVEVPLGIDRPYWIDDSEIDIEYHVRHIALPKPGDWRQLMIQMARLTSRKLDLTRPAWEAYVIEGLDNIEGIAKGSFALYLKMHHASIDGQSSVNLLQSLHTLTPEPEDSGIASKKSFVADREPTKLELTAKAVVNRSKQVMAIPGLTWDVGKALIKLMKKESGGIDEILDAIAARVSLHPASQRHPEAAQQSEEPHTRFNVDISPHRVIDAFGIPLSDCKSIRQYIPDVTINDIFMSVVGGGINKYLTSHGELPDITMKAMVPVAGQASSKDNNFGIMALPMHTNIADPIKRLKAINVDAIKGKELQAEIGTDLNLRMMDMIPPSLLAKISRAYIGKTVSMVVSNVRGPETPLYLAGSKLQMYVPASIPYDKAALNVTGYSYAGVLWVCMISCRDVMPDPGFFIDCMKQSFAELLAAAVKLEPLHNKPASRRIPARRSKKTS